VFSDANFAQAPEMKESPAEAGLRDPVIGSGAIVTLFEDDRDLPLIPGHCATMLSASARDPAREQLYTAFSNSMLDHLARDTLNGAGVAHGLP
jgi:hypothetical protein